MSKKTNNVPSKKEVLIALATITAFVNGSASSPAPEVPSIPTAEEVAALGKGEPQKLAASLKLDVEGKKEKEIKSLLRTLAVIAHDNEEEEIDEDAINALAEALGVPAAKTAEKTAAAIKKFAATLGEAGEESTEEESSDSDDAEESDDDTESEDSDEESDDSDDEEGSEEDSEDESDDAEEDDSEDDSDEEEKPAKKKGKKAAKEDDDEEESDEDDSEESDDADDSEESDDDDAADESDDTEDAEESDDEGDGVDRDAIAKKLKKLPDQKTMIARLTAYNEAAEESIEVNVKKPASVEAAYRTLVAALVGSDEKIAEWGKPYIRDGAGWSCGLPLGEVKGKDDQGKCAVTGTVWAYDDDSEEFSEVAAKKSKK